MKAWITFSAVATIFVGGSSIGQADDFSAGTLVDSYRVAKAANSYVIEPKEIKERPFTIQVASHINEKEAIQHVEQLRVQEETVFYYPNFVKSQVFFKVCVGRFDNKEAADAYRKDFVRRMDEPFAVTITMFDRPGDDKKATKAQMASANANGHGGDRALASVETKVEKSAAIDLKKEATAVNPAPGKLEMKPDAHKPEAAKYDAAKHEAPKAEMNVKMMPKVKASHKVEDKIENKKSVASHASPVAAVANSNTTTGTKSYALQIAAYPTEAMAKAESAKVAFPGQEVYFLAADVNGKTWYRVFVGKFKNFKEAQAFQEVYKEQHPGQTIVRKFMN